jgi:hypothetical protein
MLGGFSCHHSMVRTRVAANMLNKQPRTNDNGWSSSWGVGPGANSPSHRKKEAFYETTEPRT